MPFETELKFIVRCEACPTKKVKTLRGGEFGILEEEAGEIVDFLHDLEFNALWTLERVSYEEHHFFCPECSEKREAD